MKMLSAQQIRLAARYRALRSLATEVRRLVKEQDEESWAREHKAVEKAVCKEADALDRKADQVQERCPWVTEWEP